ncbi:TPA: DUF2713 family protein [Escherichia coli]|nr:DUF2713 family protein [Escherichia coli]EFM1970927.1 DUF2713 family protein [Escherichia coli]HAH7721087.1 DUF2713 family protein [Escherichia coli]HAH8843219.1 DUF2713 family protein [Escherichia coli]HAH8866834.1 DUF2713 family protein [Escherichia coli]HAM4610374.1 DUF2713 family protein [Escherichia coli]
MTQTQRKRYKIYTGTSKLIYDIFGVKSEK